MNLEAAILQVFSDAVQQAKQAALANSERQVLTIAEAAAEYGYPEGLIRTAIRGGALKHQKVGDGQRPIYYITRAWIREWQEATATGGK